MDAPGLPLGLLLLVLVAMPVCVAVVLGAISTRRMTPLAFHCRRCAAAFTRPPYCRFPTACPRCRSRRWNALP